MKKTLCALGAAALVAGSMVAGSAPSFAEDKGFQPKKAGTIMVRLRGVGVFADGTDDVKTTAGVDTGLDTAVGNDFIPEVDFSYFFTDNIAVELIAGTSKHRVSAGNGAVDLGDIWLLPPTLTLQYHPLPASRISPYIGAGLNYTFFYGGHAGAVASVDYENSIGYALQAGIDFQLDDRWGVNLDVKKLWLDTDVTVNTGAAILKSDVDLNPWIVGFGISYKF